MRILLTYCSNNYGPWQYPEKLIPVVTVKAAGGEAIPLYGDGLNVRDWVYVDDHVEALLLAATRGRLGASFCVVGSGERNNRQVVEAICALMDQLRPQHAPHARLITLVSDRPGHDRRYSIDPTLMRNELGLQPCHTFEKGLESTIRWFLNNHGWCHQSDEATVDLKVTGKRMRNEQESSASVRTKEKSTAHDWPFHTRRG